VEEIYSEKPEGKMDTKGDELEVFSTLEVHTDTEQKNLVVAVRQGPIFGTAFHPELTRDNRLHEWWVKEVVIPSWNTKTLAN